MSQRHTVTKRLNYLDATGNRLQLLVVTTTGSTVVRLASGHRMDHSAKGTMVVKL
jgi:hypothetical protein